MEGRSGSSVRTQNNELVAVFHSANESAKTGLAAAFRSEGYIIMVYLVHIIYLNMT
ncbi:hypothetical protein ONA02_02950 [Mycoplasmopsis felis]|nr:hypothetical protein [Mycoplasmopsis felis]WAM02750.1 hypothetical protein ONA02_02950 [Mycoplasmopsis felis]